MNVSVCFVLFFSILGLKLRAYTLHIRVTIDNNILCISFTFFFPYWGSNSGPSP
jgi:hypothetical protein